MTRALLRGLMLAMMLLHIACSAGGDTDQEKGRGVTATINGQVFYRERISLPPGAVVEVQLQDVSRADAAAVVLGNVTLTPRGGPPYAFSLDYDPQKIDERMRYSLRATIHVEGQLRFTSDSHIDPFDSDSVDVLVRSVPGRSRPAEPTLEHTQWVLQTLVDSEVVVGGGGRSPDLQLVAEELRAAGFSGCNRFSTAYEAGGDPSGGDPSGGTALSFGPSAGTMMACPEGMELERSYLQMLASVTGFRLQDQTLTLLSDTGELATFKPASSVK